MDSLWNITYQIKKRPHLMGDMQAEVVVIGAGMAGVLTAYLLKLEGMEPIVLERGRIGGGVTGGTTAKITSQHGLIYDRLIDQFSKSDAGTYLRVNEEAMRRIGEIVKALNVDCDYRQCPAYVYALEDLQSIRQELHAAKSLGMEAELVGETELPFPIKGAIRFPAQAQFHPTKFLGAVAEQVNIYEDTPVLAVKDNLVVTPWGQVTADYMIVASHYPFINVPGYFFTRMYQSRSYLLALENAARLDGMYIDAEENGLTFRGYGDTLLLGGGAHRTGENQMGGRYDLLRRDAQRLYPDSREIAHWSAQDCITPDCIPFVGIYSNKTPELYVATGFNKWGMTGSMAAATMLADRITGKKNEAAELFSAQRFKLGASLKSVVANGGEAARGLVKQGFSLPETHTDSVKRGHGAIVEFEGEKVGVYRDEKGLLYLVTTKCPHLGCQLEWNADELSWDCPCHGSRFDYTGTVLNSPAIEDLSSSPQHSHPS